MLVLTLNSKNCVELDGGIKIQLLQSKSGQTRIGIDAPPSVKIRRSLRRVR